MIQEGWLFVLDDFYVSYMIWFDDDLLNQNI